MEAELAFYCLREFGWKPSETLALSREEKAFLLACASEQAQATKKALSDVKQKSRKR